MTRPQRGRLVVAVVACLACAQARADDAVASALSTPVTAAWTGLPLRQAAARLGKVGDVAVVLDRRLDPGTLVSLEADGEPLADVLARVAKAARAEVVTYAGHVRIVPPGRGPVLAAAEARRLAELRSLTPRLRRTVTAVEPWAWAEGAVPQDLVALAANGIDLEGLDRLPHDHFPGAELPPLALASRLDLVLAHFDVRVAWMPLRAGAADRPSFAIVDVGPGDDPPASPRPQARRPEPRRAPAAAAATYTLRVAAPLEDLLATLARRFSLALDLDRDSLATLGVNPAEIVRLEVEDATRERLLDTILAPLGLAWRIGDGRLSVSAAPR